MTRGFVNSNCATTGACEAVVLAGGLGTRLAGVVSDVPKPMASVAGRPFLRYVLDCLADAGVERVVLAVGYKHESVEGFFGSFYRGMDICYSREDVPLQTGGAAKQALAQCEGEWAFVLNGDTYAQIDLSALDACAAQSQDADVVMACVHVQDASRYGTVDVGGDGRVRGFREKQAGSTPGLVNAGAYLLRTDALDAMPDAFPLENGFFESLAGTGRLMAVEQRGLFVDIGTPEDYDRAQELLAPFAHGWKIAFFDRDGTINVDKVHLHDPDQLELVDPAVELLRRYSEDESIKVVVATNQGGIAKGLYTARDMRHVHKRLSAMLEARGAHVDAYYHCPHHPDFTGSCACRKPAPGMLQAAMRDFDAVPQDCVMYGNSDTDRQAALAAGIRYFDIAEVAVGPSRNHSTSSDSDKSAAGTGDVR